MAELHDIKGAAEDALDKAYKKVEELAGQDFDGDGVVGDGAGAPSILEAAKNKAEEITGKDLDGDGAIGSNE